VGFSPAVTRLWVFLKLFGIHDPLVADVSPNSAVFVKTDFQIRLPKKNQKHKQNPTESMDTHPSGRTLRGRPLCFLAFGTLTAKFD
jgi:hypothetical protein